MVCRVVLPFSHAVGLTNSCSVPCSSERMLNKSLSTNSDVIIYDLEDSVAPESKPQARKALKAFLNVRKLALHLP